jgi:hypothetical protein
VDCYLTEWTILFVEITYFLGVVSAFPIMVEVGRTRILELFFGEVTQKQFTTYNITFMLVASCLSILSPIIPLSTLMSLVGALVCYFFIYMIPTMLHRACLYGRIKSQTERDLL